MKRLLAMPTKKSEVSLPIVIVLCVRTILNMWITFSFNVRKQKESGKD